MEHKFNTQINQSGRLMKEFVDTVISFYQNIKQRSPACSSRRFLHRVVRWKRYTINCWRTYTQTPL